MFNDFLQYPRILRGNLFVVIFVNASFTETMAFVESLGILIGDLYVEGYTLDFGFIVERCSPNDALQGLGTQLSGSIRLCEANIRSSDRYKLRR